jgi:hypothetical protein
MEIMELLYISNPLQFTDLLLLFLITLIGVPIIYLRTGRKIKLLLKLYLVFFILISVFTPLFVSFIFSIFTINQLIFNSLGILPESIYKIDYKDLRILTNILPLSCAVWFITSLVLVIKLGKSYKN